MKMLERFLRVERIKRKIVRNKKIKKRWLNLLNCAHKIAIIKKMSGNPGKFKKVTENICKLKNILL